MNSGESDRKMGKKQKGINQSEPGKDEARKSRKKNTMKELTPDSSMRTCKPGKYAQTEGESNLWKTKTVEQIRPEK